MKELLEKIDIDHNKHILKFEDGTFELHIGTTGTGRSKCLFLR